MGKKGSTNTTVQSYTPTAEEVRLMQQAADYADAVAPNALALNNYAAGLLKDSFGTVKADYTAMDQAAQQQITQAQQGLAALAEGRLPTAYTDNMQAVIEGGVKSSLGSALASLAERGVLNSSVTDKAVAGIADSAANAMANAYSANIAQLAGLYNQQMANAGQNIAVSAGAQEAAQRPSLELWRASLGLNGASTGALSALSGRGTQTTTQTVPNGGLIGGVLTGAASGLFCFTGDTLIMTPSGEKVIRRMKVGDKVIVPTDEGEDIGTVTAVLAPHYSETYTVFTEDKSVTTTLSQPLQKKDGTFERVDRITVGTKLKGAGAVIGILKSGERKVYDIAVTGANRYLANGFVAQGGDGTWA